MAEYQCRFGNALEIVVCVEVHVYFLRLISMYLSIYPSTCSDGSQII